MSVWETSLNTIFGDPNFYEDCTYVRNGSALGDGEVVRGVFSLPTASSSAFQDTIAGAEIGTILFRKSDFANPPDIDDIVVFANIFDSQGNVDAAVAGNALQYRVSSSPSLDEVQLAYTVSVEQVEPMDRLA